MFFRIDHKQANILTEKHMRDHPRTGVVLGAIGVVICGASMLLHGPESPSPMAGMLQWFFLAAAAVCLVGSLIELANQR